MIYKHRYRYQEKRLLTGINSVPPLWIDLAISNSLASICKRRHALRLFCILRTEAPEITRTWERAWRTDCHAWLECFG